MLVAPQGSVGPAPLALDVAGDWRRDWELLLLDLARLRAWERLLFVQCGDGWIVEEAWRRVLKGFASGLDTSPGHIARAVELRGVPGKLEFRTWDGTRLPFPSQSFDRVFSIFALERGAAPAALLRELGRPLSSGGELYVLEHEHQPAGELVAALEEAGFAESHELVRRLAPSGGGAVILRARCATPSLPRAVERAAVPPAA
jgi:ubiquinone/menaquinone biosynthesis C-methylase UbiE